MFADIWVGETQGAEIAFLVALIVFLIAAFFARLANPLWSVLVAAGLAALSLGWMLL